MGKTYYIEGGGSQAELWKKKMSVGLFSTFCHPLVSMLPPCHKVSIKSMEYWSTGLHSSIPSNPFSKLP